MFVGGHGSNFESNFSLSFKQTRLRVQCVSVSHCRIINRILSSSLPIQLSCEIPVEKINKRTESLLWAEKKSDDEILLSHSCWTKRNISPRVNSDLFPCYPGGKLVGAPCCRKNTLFTFGLRCWAGKAVGEKKFWKHPSHWSRRKLK